jgi:hypothetical protein
MLDQILALVKQCGEQTIVQNPQVPNEHNEAALKLAGDSIFDGLQSAVQGGQLSQLIGFVGAGQSMMQNPVVQHIIQSFATKLTSHTGIEGSKAQEVALDTVQQVLQGALSQFGASAQSEDIMGLAQSFLGGQGSLGLGSLTTGLDKNNDGKVDMQDAVAGIVGNGALGQLAGKFFTGK